MTTQNKTFTVYQVYVRHTNTVIRPWVSKDQIKSFKGNEGYVATMCNNWSHPKFFASRKEALKVAEEKSEVTSKLVLMNRGQYMTKIYHTTCEVQELELTIMQLPNIIKPCSCGENCNQEFVNAFRREHGISMDNFKVNEDRSAYIFEE